ncbi:MAG: hypothetical protein KatS3mg019_0583 [Fimbriimonadales bacterium]|nr:MAG: hypothetical protein KatS3mg019_0583 [Fimbriimonadales bacterium]
MPEQVDSLGNPDLTIGELRLWVHRREFPNSTDYYDINWLVISACCEVNGASVWLTNDPAVMTEELQCWLHELERLIEGKRSCAVLDTMEPYLYIAVCQNRSYDAWDVEVSLTSNISNQEHWFRFRVPVEALSKAIQQLRHILERYPIVGKRP